MDRQDVLSGPRRERSTDMLQDQKIQTLLDDLLAEFGMPAEDLAAGPEALASPTQPQRRQDASQAQTDVEAGLQMVSFLVKYMLFDLEATRRENLSLRKMLEHRPEEF
jgi:hypothetical protein